MQSVMILEDDQNLAAGIKLALSGDDIDFTLIETIKDAKNALVNTKFDLLIIDINLSDGNGLQFCRDIRKNSKVAILMLTANI